MLPYMPDLYPENADQYLQVQLHQAVHPLLHEAAHLRQNDQEVLFHTESLHRLKSVCVPQRGDAHHIPYQLSYQISLPFFVL